MDRRRLLIGLLLAGVLVLAVLALRSVFSGPLSAVSVAVSELLWGPVERLDVPASPVPAEDAPTPRRQRRPETPHDRKVRTQLDETIVSFTFNEQPVLEALDFLQTLGSVNIVLDRNKLTDPNQTVTLKLSNVPLETALRLLSEQLGLQHVVADGIVFISDAETVYKTLNPPPPLPPMVERSELSREDRRVYDKLAETIVSFTFNEQPVAEAFDFLATLGELNMVLDPRAVKKDATVTLKLSNVPLATALKLMAEQLDLRYTIREKVVFLSDEAGIARRNAGAARTGLDKWPTYADRKTWRRLRETRTTLTLNEEAPPALVDFHGFAKAVGKVRISLSAAALKKKGRMARLKVKDLPIETILKLVTEQLGLTYVIRNGAVVILDEEEKRRGSP
ncbi:MAG TPA: hypothetical protein VMY39_05005 [Planctomycetota bacterium]|nr:hypothetical protein [Planctomycetota bacterium]